MDHRLKSKPLRRMVPNLDTYMVKHWRWMTPKSDLTPTNTLKMVNGTNTGCCPWTPYTNMGKWEWSPT